MPLVLPDVQTAGFRGLSGEISDHQGRGRKQRRDGSQGCDKDLNGQD